eukprot:CAMPEP_0197022376 /NCGR_PEP_ID=MMETSP1384-20130603/3287_1 /TAXON_ID=29189 /ORGANISM="Ammonia sp." /LENGTH=100 /DNA_ID=CAMNT_0042450413 /DNA_START=140 /DNA_END=439 /DNA_ORIENTATION=+
MHMALQTTFNILLIVFAAFILAIKRTCASSSSDSDSDSDSNACAECPCEFTNFDTACEADFGCTIEIWTSKANGFEVNCGDYEYYVEAIGDGATFNCGTW